MANIRSHIISEINKSNRRARLDRVECMPQSKDVHKEHEITETQDPTEVIKEWEAHNEASKEEETFRTNVALTIIEQKRLREEEALAREQEIENWRKEEERKEREARGEFDQPVAPVRKRRPKPPPETLWQKIVRTIRELF